MAATMALAQPSKDPAKPAKPATPAQPTTKPATTVQPTTPPGKDKGAQPSEAEAMQKAYVEAAKPGPNHAFLAKSVGTWDGKLKSFDDPTAPKESACTSVVTSSLGGRFCRTEVTGAEMFPGAGPFEGFGVTGFDNAIQKFTYFWADNMGTGFMTGTGELSPDKKTMTWTLTYNDPISKKSTAFKQVDHYISDNAFTMDMFGPGPDGKEAKMMEISFTRKGAK
jgi:hypothetical protein